MLCKICGIQLMMCCVRRISGVPAYSRRSGSPPARRPRPASPPRTQRHGRPASPGRALDARIGSQYSPPRSQPPPTSSYDPYVTAPARRPDPLPVTQPTRNPANYDRSPPPRVHERVQQDDRHEPPLQSRNDRYPER